MDIQTKSIIFYFLFGFIGAALIMGPDAKKACRLDILDIWAVACGVLILTGYGAFFLAILIYLSRVLRTMCSKS